MALDGPAITWSTSSEAAYGPGMPALTLAGAGLRPMIMALTRSGQTSFRVTTGSPSHSIRVGEARSGRLRT